MVEVMKQDTIAVEISLSQRGELLEAAYFQFTAHEIAKTQEVVEGVLLVDLDAEGGIVGIELLGPIVIDQLKKAISDPGCIDVLWALLSKRAPEFARAA